MVKIIADSTCDLSRELIDEYDIDIIPLNIIMGENTYCDGSDITPDEIFEWADLNKTTPKTSAVNPERVKAVLEKYKDRPVIFFGISSKMSSTCDIVRIVAEEDNYDNVIVVDSENLSTGIGLQVIRAARMAQCGADAQTIASAIEASRPYVSASFVVDTLTYLARGGRCSQVTALVGNMLKLKPEIVVSEGGMHVNRKYRGSSSSVILKYAKDMEDELLKAAPDMVFITHSGCDSSVINKIKEYLSGLNHFDKIYETRAGGVISSHCGPRTLGILYYQEERQ